MRKILSVAAGIAVSVFAFGQSLSTTQISSPAGRTTIVVPFNPQLYNNQDSRMMCEESKMSYGQLGNYIRTAFDSALTVYLKDSLNVVHLLENRTTGTASDIENLYSASKYQYTDRPEMLEDKSKYSMMRAQLKKKKKPAQEQKNGVQNGEVVSHKVDNSNRFMNVQFEDSDLIQSLILKYGAKYFLFITQFEILGDYSDPYKVAERRYTRTIKVHYSIFDAQGKFITGDFETSEFFAYENDIRKICATHFTPIVKKIARKIPR